MKWIVSVILVVSCYHFLSGVETRASPGARFSIGVGGISISTSPKIRPSLVQINVIKGRILNLFKQNSSLQPMALRLTFHDCVGHKCDGCINLQQPANNGLKVIIDAYEPIYNLPDVKLYLSRADLWSLGGIVAVEGGIRLALNKCTLKTPWGGCLTSFPETIKFEWGRKDCFTSPSQLKAFEFPSVLMSREAMFQFFYSQFGFNRMEVVTLMGAHTLGRARLNNTGFHGAWIEGHENEFDNAFFIFLRDNITEYRNEPNFPLSPVNKKFQFNLNTPGGNSQRVGMMLNTDIYLVNDIDVDPLNGTKCQLVRTFTPPTNTTCKLAVDTVTLVETYAKAPRIFLTSFINVFTTMMRHGNPNLTPITI